MGYRWFGLAFAVFAACSNTGATQDGKGGAGRAGEPETTGVGGLGIAGVGGGSAGVGGGSAGVGGGSAGVGGGSAGVGGIGGTGYVCAGVTDPACPVCAASWDTKTPIAEFCFVDQQGKVPSPFTETGTATIVSVTEVAGTPGDCRAVIFAPSTEPTKQILLQITGGPLVTVFLKVPGLPADRLNPGDTIDVKFE